MTMTMEQAKEVHEEVHKMMIVLVTCLDEHKAPRLVGEMALMMVAGMSAGAKMEPLTDLLIPALEIGWKRGVESITK